MTTWPITLPAYPLLEKYAEAMPSTSIRTDMDSGPAKIRQRTTAGVRQLSVGYLLSKSQVSDLEGFYSETLKGGSLSFEFTHPRDDTTVLCRFVEPPSYNATNGDYFNVSIGLEILP